MAKNIQILPNQFCIVAIKKGKRDLWEKQLIFYNSYQQGKENAINKT